MKKLIFILSLCLTQTIHASSILFLGDSLTEGHGLANEQAYPILVQEFIQKKLKKDVTIINGGVSGSTTSDALARLKWYSRKKPNVIFIALGANDGLRGLDLEQSQKNLEKIIEYGKNSKAKVLLAGMMIPPNYGPDYSQKFQQIYKDLGEKYQLKVMPFLLEGVAGKKEFNQKDGIHPNELGHKKIAENVFEFLKGEL